MKHKELFGAKNINSQKMADVFQFEIDETHPDANFDPDDNDELILDRNDVSTKPWKSF